MRYKGIGKTSIVKFKTTLGEIKSKTYAAEN